MPDKISILTTAALPPAQGTLPGNMSLHTIPFIHTEEAVHAEQAVQIRELAQQRAHVLFTSVHAVRAVTGELSVVPDWRLYCIDGPTAKAAADFFGEARMAAKAHYGAELAAKLLTVPDVHDCVFFCGNKRLDTIPFTLQQHGINCRELAVYETTLTPQQLTSNYNAILFFSPSGAESFFSCNTLPPSTVLFAIGDTTARALQRYAGNIIITATSPGKHALLETAVRYLENTLA